MPHRLLTKIIPLGLSVKDHSREIGGLCVALFANITAREEQALFWVQFLSYAAGFTASCVVVWSIIRKQRNHRHHP